MTCNKVRFKYISSFSFLRKEKNNKDKLFLKKFFCVLRVHLKYIKYIFDSFVCQLNKNKLYQTVYFQNTPPSLQNRIKLKAYISLSLKGGGFKRRGYGGIDYDYDGYYGGYGRYGGGYKGGYKGGYRGSKYYGYGKYGLNGYRGYSVHSPKSFNKRFAGNSIYDDYPKHTGNYDYPDYTDFISYKPEYAWKTSAYSSKYLDNSGNASNDLNKFSSNTFRLGKYRNGSVNYAYPSTSYPDADVSGKNSFRKV